MLVEEVRPSFPLGLKPVPGCKMGSWTEEALSSGSVHPRGQGRGGRNGAGTEHLANNPRASGPQVFDAGEMFGIMQVEEAEEEESEDEAAQEARKKPNLLRRALLQGHRDQRTWAAGGHPNR